MLPLTRMLTTRSLVRGEQGVRDRSSNIGTKDSFAASLSKTFGTPITNKLGGAGMREMSATNVGSSLAASGSAPSTAKRVRPASAAPSSAAQVPSRGNSSEPNKKASTHEIRVPPAALPKSSACRPATAGSSRKSIAPSACAPSTALSRPTKPAPPSKTVLSASAARSALRGERQAAATQSGGAGARASKAPLPMAARAGPKVGAVGATKKVGSQNDKTAARDAEVQQELAQGSLPEGDGQGKHEEVAEEGEDLMAYLMPVADEDSADEACDEAADAAEADGACAPGDASLLAEQLATLVAFDTNVHTSEPGTDTHSKDDDVHMTESQIENATDTSEVEREHELEKTFVPEIQAVGVVTPHVRKVLASSDIFTPDSGCESSPGMCTSQSCCTIERRQYCHPVCVCVCARACACACVCSRATAVCSSKCRLRVQQLP